MKNTAYMDVTPCGSFKNRRFGVNALEFLLFFRISFKRCTGLVSISDIVIMRSLYVQCYELMTYCNNEVSICSVLRTYDCNYNMASITFSISAYRIKTTGMLLLAFNKTRAYINKALV
jgi:hypothetical protein